MTVKVGVHGPMFDGPTDFKRLMAGVGSFTNTSAVEVLPVPPLVELTATEFVLRPVVVPVTLTEKEQFAPAESVPPVIVILDEPATAPMVAPVKVPVVQVMLVSPLGLATTKPLGRLSPVAAGENPTPVSAVDVFGL